MGQDTDHGHRFECVQPELGEQLWKLDTADLAPELRLRLERHVKVCEDCRLQRALHARLADLGAAGELRIEVPPERPWPLRRADGFLAAAGGLALAASVALAMWLPPSAIRAPGATRGGDDAPGFLRPVEGEVVGDDTPDLRWRAVAGATAYRLEITQTDGDYAWRGETRDSALRLPEAAALPARGRFRALLEPVPVDLAPLGGLSVSFRRAGWLPTLGYRLGAAPPAVRWLGWLGAAALLLGAPLARRLRPDAARDGPRRGPV